MSFGDSIKAGFTRAIDFNGRSSRSAYWWFCLFFVLGINILTVLESAVKVEDVLVAIFQIGMFIPLLSAQVRRLHDINRSGWWLLLGLTGIGWFVILYWHCCEGDPDYNDFGPPSG